MKPLNPINNELGLGLIEALVSAGLLAVMIAIMAQVQVGQVQSQRQINNLKEKINLTEEIKNSLSLYTSCNEIILKQGLKLTNDKIEDKIKNGTDLFDLENMDSAFENNEFKFSKAQIQLKQIIDSETDTKYKIYKGNLFFSVTKKNQINSDQELKRIELPITVQKRIGIDTDFKNLKCIYSDSDLITQVSEACGYYGGVLNKGMSCDFNRNMRSDENLPADQIPVADIADRTSVKRMTFSDMLCYIDTLVTLIPDQDQANPKRKPDGDSYKATHSTTFCKRPGVVKKSDDVDVKALSETLSPDIASYFKEVSEFKDSWVLIAKNMYCGSWNYKLQKCSFSKELIKSSRVRVVLVSSDTPQICSVSGLGKNTSYFLSADGNNLTNTLVMQGGKAQGGCRARFDIYKRK